MEGGPQDEGGGGKSGAGDEVSNGIIIYKGYTLRRRLSPVWSRTSS